ncbi:protein of unknown function [Methylocaldum szegediense]|uniref:Uncharacterized protein n=1 Tax=Methylocaldum szegediense TaxID=73780 RepID=A0ABN8X2J7_9GAMM|nr:protein of unknown function [Methylocaldum szegediense]
MPSGTCPTFEHCRTKGIAYRIERGTVWIKLSGIQTGLVHGRETKADDKPRIGVIFPTFSADKRTISAPIRHFGIVLGLRRFALC